MPLHSVGTATDAVRTATEVKRAMRRATSEWLPPINEYKAHWTEYGPDRQVAGKTLAEFEGLAEAVLVALKECEDLRHQAELAAARRDADGQALYAAMRAYNGYVRAMEGPGLEHVRTAPRLAKHRRSAGNAPPASTPPTTVG